MVYGRDNLRGTMLSYTFFEKLYAVILRQTVAQTPSYYESTIYVNDSIRVHKSVSHRNIGNITVLQIWFGRSTVRFLRRYG